MNDVEVELTINCVELEWAEKYLLNKERLIREIKNAENGDLDPDTYHGMALLLLKHVAREARKESGE